MITCNKHSSHDKSSELNINDTEIEFCRMIVFLIFPPSDLILYISVPCDRYLYFSKQHR